MRLKVEHSTVFSYTAPVYETATEIRLRPTEEWDGSQRLLDFHIKTDPDARLHTYTDYFGNRVYHFNQLKPHKGLSITSIAVVETTAGRVEPVVIDELRCIDYLNESQFVQFGDELRQFASEGSADPVASPAEFAEALSRKINETFVYEPGVTDVHSASGDVIRQRRGVCQDFAHVLIAACRANGIPARYVSGYLYGGSLSERDDRASHAWCEIHAGDNTGWVGLDPTHETTFVDECYIKIGVGRDYGDVPPVRGTFKGNSTESLKVVVRISEA